MPRSRHSPRSQPRSGPGRARRFRAAQPAPHGPSARPQGAERARVGLARAARHCYGLPVFGIGLTEMILVGIVALMLFSPKELPDMIKAIARVYGSIRRTAEQFRAQVMEADELREPIEEIRAAYHGTKAEIDSARDLARRELQRARTDVIRAQQKMNELAREEAKRAPALGDRVAATGPTEQAPSASPATTPSAPPTAVPSAPVAAASNDAPAPGPIPGAVPTTTGRTPDAGPGERDVA